MSPARNPLKRPAAAIIALFAAVFMLGLSQCEPMPDKKPGELGRWVDPFIGTGGIPWASAMLFPGATSPFGMVRLSPDTTFPGGVNVFKCGTAGYFYGLNHIWGFSHTRLSGTGAVDLGHFRVTPAVGNFNPGDRLKKPIYFSHKQEVATAGYYAVNLPGINCLAELTATTHVGVHRYTFGTGKDAHILLDATSFLAGGHATEGRVKILPDFQEIEGEGRVMTDFASRYGGLKGYFVARFNKPFASFSTWSNGVNIAGRPEASGDDAGAEINFGNIKNQPVEIKIGISFVSLENARLNLDAEAGTLDFEGIRDVIRQTWEEWLSRISIESSDPVVKTNFYSALYHTMIMPTDFTDVNRQYLGFKGIIGVAGDFTYRTDMSIWDTYRDEHTLLILIAPEIQRDCLKSLVRMARIGGTLPRWPSGSGYTGSMFGTPADLVVGESWLKGITDFEVEEAYEYMKLTSTEKGPSGADVRDGNPDCLACGYCPNDKMEESVSRTLEYAWADGSISLLAAALDKPADAVFFWNKSMAYKNIFNPETRYFQPRNSDGSWQEPFFPDITSYYDDILPEKYAIAYCEGGPRHWRWTAPHDPEGLLSLFGSADYFVTELEKFMADASKNRGAIDPGPAYWIGNEHDIHTPYLFNEAGRPELTQKWVRWTLDNRFGTGPDGMDGNDDCGALSSWYVFSAIGLYPVAGTDRYWIGAPIVDRAEVNIGSGSTLTVIAENQSLENMYVQSVTLNGTKLLSPSLKHADIMNGGTLVFTMGPLPAAGGGY